MAVRILNDDEKALREIVERIKAKAYAQGQQDAIKALAETAAASLSGQFSLALPKPPGRQRARKGATVGAVRQVISDNPGLKGIEIARKVAEINPESSERTVRTSLRRLKLDGEIRQRDGRWYKTRERVRLTNDTGQTDEV